MTEMIERVAKALMAAAYEAMGRPDLVRDPNVGGRMEIAGVDVRMLARVAIEEIGKEDAADFAASVMQVGMTVNPLLDIVPVLQVEPGQSRYENHSTLSAWSAPRAAADLKREFGYDVDPDDAWKVFDGRLIVIHPARRPRVYRRGCAGIYYEMDPLP